MKKINLIFALMILCLAGCSTFGIKTAPARDSLDIESDQTAAVKSESVKEQARVEPKPEEIEEPPVVKMPPSRGQYTELSQAIQQNNDERIYQAAVQILTKSGSDPKALNALAMYHYKKGRYDLSRYLLAKAIAADGRSSGLQSNMGLVHMALNETREAIQAFKKALQLNSSEVSAAANLGAIYVKEKDYPKAAVALQMAYKKGLKDPAFLNNYGIVMVAQGNYPEAKEAYEKAIKANSNSPEIMLNLSILYIDHMKNYREGLDILNRLKFLGGPDESRNRINALENKALAGLN